jgi:hypothetical protein
MKPVTVKVRDMLSLMNAGQWSSPTKDWRIMIGIEQQKPNNTITLFDYTSTDQRYLDCQASGSLYKVRVQVRVRGKEYTASYEKAMEIHELLLKESLEDDDAIYQGIEVVSAPNSLGKDDDKRHIWVASYETIWKKSIN